MKLITENSFICGISKNNIQNSNRIADAIMPYFLLLLILFIKFIKLTIITPAMTYQLDSFLGPYGYPVNRKCKPSKNSNMEIIK